MLRNDVDQGHRVSHLRRWMGIVCSSCLAAGAGCHPAPPGGGGAAAGARSELSFVRAPDTTPYGLRLCWPAATLLDESPPQAAYRPTPHPRWTIAPGEQTVLMARDGWTGGLSSRTHASDDTLYFVLPGSLEPGQVLHPSPDADTLVFESFRRDTFWIRDDMRPVDATVEILEVDERHIEAAVAVSFTVIEESSAPLTWSDRKDRPHDEFTIEGTETFVRAPPRGVLEAVVSSVRPNGDRTTAEIDAGSREGVQVGWLMAAGEGPRVLAWLRIVDVEIDRAIGVVEYGRVEVGSRAWLVGLPEVSGAWGVAQDPG